MLSIDAELWRKAWNGKTPACKLSALWAEGFRRTRDQWRELAGHGDCCALLNNVVLPAFLSIWFKVIVVNPQIEVRLFWSPVVVLCPLGMCTPAPGKNPPFSFHCFFLLSFFQNRHDHTCRNLLYCPSDSGFYLNCTSLSTSAVFAENHRKTQFNFARKGPTFRHAPGKVIVE